MKARIKNKWVVKSGKFELQCGDSLKLLKKIPDNSIDSVICDPPYNLSFMGNAWDSFKVEKDAKSAGRNTTRRNQHPCVKPVALMEYLIKLVTPPGGIVLDHFMGSGTTGVAAVNLGFKFLGFEKNPEYFEIARLRIKHAEEENDR